jgi:hypothetical protein
LRKIHAPYAYIHFGFHIFPTSLRILTLPVINQALKLISLQFSTPASFGFSILVVPVKIRHAHSTILSPNRNPPSENPSPIGSPSYGPLLFLPFFKKLIAKRQASLISKHDW